MDNLIYKFINQSVRNVDTYQHNGSTWLIFTNDKNWVIELTKDKTLWYNYTFFKSIFDFFSIDVVENQHYITKWVEDVIKNGVKHICGSINDTVNVVEDTIQNGVKQTISKGWNDSKPVEDTIQNGVKVTNGTLRRTLLGVDDIIQNGVKETKTPGDGDIVSTVEWMKENNSNSYPKMINDVIENGVKEVYWLPNEHKLPVDDVNPVDDVIDNGEKINGTFVGGSRQKENVEVVIDYGVKETHDDVYHHEGRIEGVIKCGKIII
jgi:hypothetical protein